ncbi:MAG: Rad3-related DNA helicase, partial [Candidatus Paceibacteria bacterium]
MTKAENKETTREGAAPWERSLGSVIFVTLEQEGADPTNGNLLSCEALRVTSEAGQVHLNGFSAIHDEETPSQAWEELLEFCGKDLLVVLDSARFAACHGALSSNGAKLPTITGLTEIGALLLPGRLASQPEDFIAELLAKRGTNQATASKASELRQALSTLIRTFLSENPEVVHVVSVGLATAWSRLSVTEPVGAQRLGQVLQLLQSADLWMEEHDTGSGVQGLKFESDFLEADFLHVVLEGSSPRWTDDAKQWHEFDPLPPNRERALPWHADDRAILDAVFRDHLPGIFEEEHGGTAGKVYRASQHEVSSEVAQNFGRSVEAETQLLLVHAPTGTGKTLAYLIPALLWSKRHEVRVGIATYTRALQEQAIDREVPRALDVLARAGLSPGLRVSMLKGRENYVCWRTLKLHVPAFEGSGEQWLAFCQLLAFSLSNATGDLDRLPRRSPLELGHNETYRSTLEDLIRQVRARTSCCRSKEDKHTCGAEVARWRAERSHVVVTNHSFALARQDFFRHVIFDECEHLHDQAHSAWSHSVGLQSVSHWLDRLYKPSQSRARSLFTRIAKRIVDGTPSWEALQTCRERHDALLSAFHEIQDEVGSFEEWRKSRERERDEREEHSLLKEYAEGERGNQLVRRRLSFSQVGNQLDEKLAELNTHLEGLGTGRMARVRRGIDQARTDLDEILEGFAAWLPVQEGKPKFNARTFNDVESEGSAGQVLSARVLLPNEYLGRFYYPQLSTASFLSATTHMQGGFDAASSYLGLDRAVQASEEDPELLCRLHTFLSPEVFDYSRVLVSIPRDAPSVSRDKETFLRYTRDFIADLGERTQGRILALFTNADDVRQVGARLEGHFRARQIGFWYQNMPGSTKEELGELFRRRIDSVLLGVDTFWYGADFPGETLEHLVIVRLPYGVPDRYHHAQCAALGISEQRRQIYMPRALAKFRQGFGRLMRRMSDKGCVHILDHRVVDPRHRLF